MVKRKPMMTWGIGISQKRRKNGYTIIEVMIATAILASATAVLFQTFLVSLDRSSYLSERLMISLALSNTLWEVGDALSHASAESKDLPELSGAEVLNGKKYQWNVHLKGLNHPPSFYLLDASFIWQGQGRQITVTRAAYAGE